MLTDIGQVTVNSISLFVVLLCACVVIGHLLEENRWFSESITALLIGLGTGTIILLASGWTSSRLSVFDEELFFIYLLPPIIFNAGFLVKKKPFFQNFLTIILFGAIGTLISSAFIAIGASQLLKKLDIGFLAMGDYLAIGAILSATDSVCTLQVLNQDETPFLYSLVFGEGVLNDAISIVLFNTIQKLDVSDVKSGIVLQFTGNFLTLFITNTLLGILIGLPSAYIIKKLYFSRQSTDHEIALMILMAYFSDVMAELFHLSGILTVFFCGIVMSHCTWHIVTENSRVTTRHVFVVHCRGLHLCLCCPRKLIGLSSALLGMVLVGRAAFVFPLFFLTNLTKRSDGEKISFKQQVIIWWAGLIRVAVSMALAYNQFTSSGHTQLPGNAIMITSTITVVLFSALLFGIVTRPLIRFLLPLPRHWNDTHSDIPSQKSLILPLLDSKQEDLEADTDSQTITRQSSLRMLLTAPTHTIHHYWRKIDDAFMRPVFGGRRFVPCVPGSPH